MRIKNICKSVVIYLVFAMLSAVFLLVASHSTTPLISRYYAFDSSIFQTVGKMWSKGILPYKECFDHKGPVLFFIEMLGYSLGMDRLGLFVIQTLVDSAAFYVIYKTLGLFVKNVMAFILTLPGYMVLAITIDEGNLSEEYSLIFLALAVYCSTKYFIQIRKSDDVTHPWKYAIVYGLCFGALVCIRMTNALILCCEVLVIFCVLLWNKEIKCIWKNAIGFLAGILLCFAPFLIYFAYRNGLYDLIYGTLIYNLQYTEDSVFEWKKDVIEGLLLTIFTVVISVLHLLIYQKKKNYLAVASILSAVLSMFMFLKMNGYVHYYTVDFVLYPLFVGMGIEILSKFKSSQVAKIISVVVIAIFCVELGVGGMASVRKKWSLSTHASYAKAYLEFSDEIMSYVPKEEQNDILTFGDVWLSTWYLVNDTVPPFKYCILQDWQAKSSPDMKKEIVDYFENNPCKWLLVKRNTVTNGMYLQYNSDLLALIESKYEIVGGSDIVENYVICKRKY